MLTRGLAADYEASRPSSATIYTNDPFDDDLVNAVRQTRGVKEAEGRHNFSVRARVGTNSWRELQLAALADYSDVRVNKVTLDRGIWPPPRRQFLIERSSVPSLKAHVGDWVTVRLRDGKERQIRLAGIVHDINQFATPFTGIAYGYVTGETAEWLRETPGYNELYVITSGDPRDKANVERVTQRVQDKIELSGRSVFRVYIQAGKHWLDDPLRALILILEVLGALSLLLSGFLVVNTISSVLAQQIRQIGVMKAIGARGSQITAMYALPPLPRNSRDYAQQQNTPLAPDRNIGSRSDAESGELPISHTDAPLLGAERNRVYFIQYPIAASSARPMRCAGFRGTVVVIKEVRSNGDTVGHARAFD